MPESVSIKKCISRVVVGQGKPENRGKVEEFDQPGKVRECEKKSENFCKRHFK